MCYTRRKIEGGVVALRESDNTNFLKPNGQSRNLNIYESNSFQIYQVGSSSYFTCKILMSTISLYFLLFSFPSIVSFCLS